MNRLTGIGIGVAGSIVLFGAGLLVGREFPMHHYERFGQSPYLYDTSTGKMCNPFKKPDTNLLDEGVKTPSNPFGFVPTVPAPSQDNKNPFNNLFNQKPESSSEYPQCGK